jgi:hypothetical protein
VEQRDKPPPRRPKGGGGFPFLAGAASLALVTVLFALSMEKRREMAALEGADALWVMATWFELANDVLVLAVFALGVAVVVLAGRVEDLASDLAATRRKLQDKGS